MTKTLQTGLLLLASIAVIVFYVYAIQCGNHWMFDAVWGTQ